MSKSNMNAREMKAMAQLSEALKAKVKAKRAKEANTQRSKDFEARKAEILRQLDDEQARINHELFELNRELEAASKDVNLALDAASNEDLVLFSQSRNQTL